MSSYRPKSIKPFDLEIHVTAISGGRVAIGWATDDDTIHWVCCVDRAGASTKHFAKRVDRAVQDMVETAWMAEDMSGDWG